MRSQAFLIIKCLVALGIDKEWRAQSKLILCCLQSLFIMFLVRIIEVVGIFFAMEFYIIFIMKAKQMNIVILVNFSFKGTWRASGSMVLSSSSWTTLVLWGRNGSNSGNISVSHFQNLKLNGNYTFTCNMATGSIIE